MKDIRDRENYIIKCITLIKIILKIYTLGNQMYGLANWKQQHKLLIYGKSAQGKITQSAKIIIFTETKENQEVVFLCILQNTGYKTAQPNNYVKILNSMCMKLEEHKQKWYNCTKVVK